MTAKEARACWFGSATPNRTASATPNRRASAEPKPAPLREPAPRRNPSSAKNEQREPPSSLSKAAQRKAAKRARDNWQSRQRGTDVSRSVGSAGAKKAKDPFAGKNGKSQLRSREQRSGIDRQGPYINPPADSEIHRRIGPTNPDGWDGA